MPKDKNGILGTVIFHNLLLLLLIFFGFTKPKEPLDMEGIIINFGNEDQGSGISKSLEASEIEEVVQQSVPHVQEISVKDASEDILTQDFEKAPSVAKKKTEKKQDIKKVEETPREVEKPAEKPVEQPRQVDKRALYSGKSKSSASDNSEGIESQGGNQGKPDGSADSDSYSLGTGSGVSFDLEGRGSVSLPKPELIYQKQGIVKVEITVDKQGNVISVTAGIKGSTTLDTYLLNAAKAAALKSKFTASPEAPFHQKGYITYHFKLQSGNY